ncbi:MAG: hypothetical protein Q8L48_43985 [Archangium sp.]|nr:hypothetical protein [Archangium sp.]
MEVVQVSFPGRHVAALGLALSALAFCACNNDPSKTPPKFRLEGSLGQVMDVGYDVARIDLTAADVSLTFVRLKPVGSPGADDGGAVGMSEDYPVKIGYRLLGDPVGGRVDLAALDMNGAQRGTISRNVANDPRNTLPLILRGTLYFDRPLDPNAVVGGDFHITFENGIEAASGRTVFSKSFSATVQP